jgi:hypothetical protein
MGFFEDYIDPRQAAYQVTHADISLQQTLLEQAQDFKNRWKEAISNYYFQSYSFSHYHGKLLRKLSSEIFNFKNEMTPTLAKLCQWGELQQGRLLEAIAGQPRLPAQSLALDKLQFIHTILTQAE